MESLMNNNTRGAKTFVGKGRKEVHQRKTKNAMHSDSVRKRGGRPKWA